VRLTLNSCGPFKLGTILSQCLKRYDSTSSRPDSLNTPYKQGTEGGGSRLNRSDLIADLAPRLGLYPPLVVHSKDPSNDALGQSLSPPDATQEKSEPTVWAGPHRVLVVDDNAINRKLLAIFMKKRKIRFAEARDGKEALEIYRDADEKFDTILMDISMPVMDGMTSTRLIREHENKANLKPAHIIVLTGLTSASAKLEAWTSGVDDFLTKPVNFNNLDGLMKAGRGGEGTGFMHADEKNLPERNALSSQGQE
jgi:CheY-like chemotaxis protein